MDTITRKSLLYKSGLDFYCINHVQGCSHGCRYPCYAFMMARSYGRVDKYTDWCNPKLVSNAEHLLTKELSRFKSKLESVHLCLTTDPFMNGHPEVSEMSLKLIALINSYGIPCSILTKGKLPVNLADSKSFHPDNIHGISLISLNEDFRKLWEPGSASYSDRISSLKYIHDQGMKTLAHIEPYPTPNILQQNLEDILKSVKFVDQIYFSGWNYNHKIKNHRNYRKFYSEQSILVQNFCNKQGIRFDSGV